MRSHPDLIQVEVVGHASLQPQPPHQVIVSTLQQLVEDVEVALSLVQVTHARLLQQVVNDVSTNGRALQQHKTQQIVNDVSANRRALQQHKTQQVVNDVSANRRALQQHKTQQVVNDVSATGEPCNNTKRSR